MPRPLQDVVGNWISRFLMDSSATGFIEDDERRYISSDTRGVFLSKLQNAPSGKKIQSWTKYPDAAILFGEPGSRMDPRVVFEVGFSETYDDLVSDARQWLERSGGHVRLVDEDKRSLMLHQETSLFTSRVKHLIEKFGTDLAKVTAGMTPANSEDSDAEMYDDIRSNIITADWIGSIAISLELWELSGGISSMRGPRIAVFPVSPNQKNPIINIMDLIPEGKKGLFANFDNSRTAELDINLYRQLLISAIECTAYHRAMRTIRPRPTEQSDPNYSPDSGSGYSMAFCV